MFGDLENFEKRLSFKSRGASGWGKMKMPLECPTNGGVSFIVGLLLLGFLLILSSELLTLPFEVPGFSSSSSTNESQFHDCEAFPQAFPVFANKVGGLDPEFFLSLLDLGVSEENFQGMTSGKLFGPVEISGTVQAVLKHLRSRNVSGGFVDVGANIGWASFAASALGFNVLAFEPVLENVNKLCDGIHFNRAHHLVKLVHAGVSDSPGTLRIHKVKGRYDNTAVSEVGATMYIKSDIIPMEVSMVTLDSFVDDGMEVAMIKIDVQGWELHVLKGARRLLSRPANRAPYILYEDNEPLLKASNTTSSEVANFLEEVGYTKTNCAIAGGDRHCSKRHDDLAWIK